MALSVSKPSLNGLTLIEVLIALAIIAIALTAVIKATSQSIRGTRYLQDKTIALWVGQAKMSEVRVGTLTVGLGSSTKKSTVQFGQTWYWQASLTDTPNKQIKQITVDVSQGENEPPLIHLESFVYRGE